MSIFRRVVSAIAVCVVVAYIVFLLIIVIKVFQDRLLQNHKCFKNPTEKFDLENVTELLFPRYTFMPQRDEIACFVMTKADNKFARSVIRRTWGKSIKPIFIMNLPENHVMKFLIDEAVLYNDMIVLNDSINADNEHSYAMKYFKEYFNISEYFLYVKDDVFINTKNLFNFLNDEIPSNVVVGNFVSITHQSRTINWMSNFLNLPLNSFHFNRPDLNAFIAPGN